MKKILFLLFAAAAFAACNDDDGEPKVSPLRHNQ